MYEGLIVMAIKFNKKLRSIIEDIATINGHSIRVGDSYEFLTGNVLLCESCNEWVYCATDDHHQIYGSTLISCGILQHSSNPVNWEEDVLLQLGFKPTWWYVDAVNVEEIRNK